MLNATLTVRAHEAASHQGHGWETFTDAVIAHLAATREHLVFLLWGAYAIKKGAFIDRSRHLVLTSPHPSPLSAHRGFFGNHHFSQANAYLLQHGETPISGNYETASHVIAYVVGNADLCRRHIDTHFRRSMRSLRACLETDYYAPPIIELGGDDRVRVEFDDINSERRYMRYSLLHCDAAWQPSQIVESDYVDGFNQADVEDCEFSSGTFEQYVHYGISLPNQDMPILLSGNYLLKVYLEDNPDCVLLQQRFCVVEKRVGIGASVSSRTDVDYNDSHQQISITINTATGASTTLTPTCVSLSPKTSAPTMR